ncbi:hypothetical protein [Bifidobacterium pseudolongum]|uniref:hypothetical protein n=1 Tax=Bifidobacterium pseudolongum TaxID=1694 RepID=UPI001F5DFD0E|nr:hypothetical protein [Bifidobacterium pseudolongum]
MFPDEQRILYVKSVFIRRYCSASDSSGTSKRANDILAVVAPEGIGFCAPSPEASSTVGSILALPLPYGSLLIVMHLPSTLQYVPMTCRGSPSNGKYSDAFAGTTALDTAIADVSSTPAMRIPNLFDLIETTLLSLQSSEAAITMTASTLAT